jgi:hypothetical protein
VNYTKYVRFVMYLSQPHCVDRKQVLYQQSFVVTLFITVCQDSSEINPLNAELNPICHSLILLGDLTFMGKCIVSISNKIQRYTVYLYLETALHVSDGTSTHLQHLVFVISLLLSAAIAEELEPV